MLRQLLFRNLYHGTHRMQLKARSAFGYARASTPSRENRACWGPRPAAQGKIVCALLRRHECLLHPVGKERMGVQNFFSLIRFAHPGLPPHHPQKQRASGAPAEVRGLRGPLFRQGLFDFPFAYPFDYAQGFGLRPQQKQSAFSNQPAKRRVAILTCQNRASREP